MRSEKLTDVKNNFSAMVERVRHGERIRILSHGVPVAELVPIEDLVTQESGQLIALERMGIIRRGSGVIHPALLQPGPCSRGRPLSDYVREERDESR